MVVHRPQGCDGQDDVCYEEEFVVCSPNAIERESEKEAHSNGSQLAVPEIALGPVL